MTSTTKRHPAPADRTYHVVFGAVIAVLVVAALVVLTRPTGGATSADSGPKPLTPTGERSAMGMPVLHTPGSASGRAAAGGVAVDGAVWAMGRVPLNIAVRPTWTLRNTSPAPVTLGEPKAEVRQGCCPGPLTLGTRTLAPGAETTLTFELSMHDGMDGPHDLAVHVPVASPTTNDHLTVAVNGDFR